MTKEQIEEKIRFLREELDAITIEGCECPAPSYWPPQEPPCEWCCSAGPGLLDEIDHLQHRLRGMAEVEKLQALPNWSRF